MIRSNSPSPSPTYADLPDADLCLVQCVKTMRDAAAPARELYCSALFRKMRNVAETAGWRWLVVCAHHGLVDPDSVIGPSDTTLANMPRRERDMWAACVLRDLEPRLAGVRSVVFFASKLYRETLAPALERRGIAVHIPMDGMPNGKQMQWLNGVLASTPPSDPSSRELASSGDMAARNPLETHGERLADAARFYRLLDRLERRVGGSRVLVRSSGWTGWPERGVYFFFEKGETRSGSGRGPRVVRVGTHGLKEGVKVTLWQRLAQHRGVIRSGGGDHRTSTFREAVGTALGRRPDSPLPPSWGVGRDPDVAARRLGTTVAAVLANEAEMERRVSGYIGEMPLLWMEVDDPTGPDSDRGFIARNAIALLSRARPIGPDAASGSWLGRFSDRKDVRDSGLWNQRHVHEEYDPTFLDAMERMV